MSPSEMSSPKPRFNHTGVIKVHFAHAKVNFIPPVWKVLFNPASSPPSFSCHDICFHPHFSILITVCTIAQFSLFLEVKGYKNILTCKIFRFFPSSQCIPNLSSGLLLQLLVSVLSLPLCFPIKPIQRVWKKGSTAPQHQGDRIRSHLLYQHN